jgi:chromosome segregation ATPase
VIPSLLHIVTRGVLVATLTLSGLLGMVGGDEINDLREQYETLSQQRAQTLDRMESLRADYQGLVERIDRLKASGTGELSNRRSVQQLLSQSQEIARRLERLQARVREFDARLKSMRADLVSTIDASVATIEEKLRAADADARDKWVDQLNELRKLRRQYRIPLPEAPNLDEIQATLRMAKQVESGRPDQMQAAADELEDTEDQVRSRLQAVEEKLAQLEQARTLARRAESFRSEEQFFDEASRPRSVGHHESRSSSGGGNSGDEERLGAGDDPQFGNQEGANPPPLDQNPGGGESSEFVLENEADPGEIAEDDFSNGSGLERRIKRLRRERQELERQAHRLRQQADTLRSRAQELESFEE